MYSVSGPGLNKEYPVAILALTRAQNAASQCREPGEHTWYVRDLSDNEVIYRVVKLEDGNIESRRPEHDRATAHP